MLPAGGRWCGACGAACWHWGSQATVPILGVIVHAWERPLVEAQAVVGGASCPAGRVLLRALGRQLDVQVEESVMRAGAEAFVPRRGGSGDGSAAACRPAAATESGGWQVPRRVARARPPQPRLGCKRRPGPFSALVECGDDDGDDPEDKELEDVDEGLAGEVVDDPEEQGPGEQQAREQGFEEFSYGGNAACLGRSLEERQQDFEASCNTEVDPSEDLDKGFDGEVVGNFEEDPEEQGLGDMEREQGFEEFCKGVKEACQGLSPEEQQKGFEEFCRSMEAEVYEGGIEAQDFAECVRKRFEERYCFQGVKGNIEAETELQRLLDKLGGIIWEKEHPVEEEDQRFEEQQVDDEVEDVAEGLEEPSFEELRALEGQVRGGVDREQDFERFCHGLRAAFKEAAIGEQDFAEFCFVARAAFDEKGFGALAEAELLQLLAELGTRPLPAAAPEASSAAGSGPSDPDSEAGPAG